MPATPPEPSDYAAIRRGVGVSMAEDLAVIRVRGASAGAYLDTVVSGPVERLVENGILWTALLDDEGRVEADVQLYNDFGDYLVTCERRVAGTVRAAVERARPAGVELEDLTGDLAIVAVEGPDALDLPERIVGDAAVGLPSLRFTRCHIDGGDVLLSRIGFSGEFSYLFLAHRERADDLYHRVREVAPGATPCGRAIQGLLRLEMRAPNPAVDFLQGETALEAGLHWMIDFRKPAFRGRAAVLDQMATGLGKRMVCLVAEPGAGIAAGDDLRAEGSVVGYVANAAWSPAVGREIGVAYVDATHAWVGLALEHGSGRVHLVSAPMVVPESSRRRIP